MHIMSSQEFDAEPVIKRRSNSKSRPPRIDVDQISEPQLRDCGAARAITAAKVVRTEAGFILVINLNWKGGDFTVICQRNVPRVWQSVDRLIGHLKRVAPSITHMELFLNHIRLKSGLMVLLKNVGTYNSKAVWVLFVVKE